MATTSASTTIQLVTTTQSYTTLASIMEPQYWGLQHPATTSTSSSAQPRTMDDNWTSAVWLAICTTIPATTGVSSGNLLTTSCNSTLHKCTEPAAGESNSTCTTEYLYPHTGSSKCSPTAGTISKTGCTINHTWDFTTVAVSQHVQ